MICSEYCVLLVMVLHTCIHRGTGSRKCAKLYGMPYECEWAWYHVTNEYLVSVVLLELLWSHMPSLNCSIPIHTCTYSYMAMYIMDVWCTANLHMPQTTLH